MWGDIKAGHVDHLCFHIFFIYRLIYLFSYILLNLFIHYLIGLDFIGNNFNINVVMKKALKYKPSAQSIWHAF